MRARRLTLMLVLAVAAATVPAGAADQTTPAADQTTLTVTKIVTGATTVTVHGLLTLGSSAFAPMTVSTDPIGDATIAGQGFDIGDTVATVSDYATTPKPKLTLTMTADGSLPPALSGYRWPIMFNGNDEGRWLAVGTAGTGYKPGTGAGAWVGKCRGWICTPVNGSMGATGVTWELPVNGAPLKPGSKVEASPTAPTWGPGDPQPSFGAVPASFVWPWERTVHVMDTAGPIAGFTLPGGVEVGISDSVEEEPASYLAARPIDKKTGAYAVSFAHPGPGQYVLWVRSCHGLFDNLTCVRHTQDLTL